MKVETTKAPQGRDPADTLPGELAGQDRQSAALDSMLGTPVYPNGHQMHTCKWIFWMVEAREDILTGHQAEPSGHRTKQTAQ